MREIILASGSEARQRLLRQIGLNFTVVKPDIYESRGKAVTKDRAGLVKENARKKAESVVKKFDKGVVIGADTLVFSGSRVIGKPKNIEEAAENLKFLSSRPHWVYTGVSVADIEKRKFYSGYGKTKVYMTRITDDRIKHYLEKNPPMNKAGGFDVSGPGAVFIKRIEGCFYNVVGMPLFILNCLLSKTGEESL